MRVLSGRHLDQERQWDHNSAPPTVLGPAFFRELLTNDAAV
jgi:hypothetical protein